MQTEAQNPRTTHLDQMSALELVQVMNDEDRTVVEAVNAVLPEIAAAVEVIAGRLRDGGRLLYIGAGTSGRLGVLDAVECVPTFSVPPGLVIGVLAGGDAALTTSVEDAEDDREQGAGDLRGHTLTAKDVVVGIAASGRTPYVLGAVDYARSVGAATIGIACNVPSALLEAVDQPIGIAVGAEVLSGSTRLKAGTAQKMVLNMLSTASMVQLGKVYGNLMVDVQITNQKLAIRARNILMQITSVDSDTADALLADAGKSVKVAALMHTHQLSAQEARERLQQAGGNLRTLLEDSIS